jgi:hypothetical protein
MGSPAQAKPDEWPVAMEFSAASPNFFYDSPHWTSNDTYGPVPDNSAGWTGGHILTLSNWTGYYERKTKYFFTKTSKALLEVVLSPDINEAWQGQ